MSEESESKEPAIYLNQTDILEWEAPPKPGFMRIPLSYFLDGKTELTRALELKTLDVLTGQYRVFASAIPYTAEITRLGDEFITEKETPFSNPMKEEMLFSGNISIYTTGEIPGTKINGTTLEKSGKLWFGVPLETARDWNQSRLLETAIFGEEATPEKVEAILRGYENQRKARNEAEFRAQTRRAKDAADSALWRANHGYFPWSNY